MQTDHKAVSLEALAHLLPPSSGVPNHPRWPLLVYQAAVPIAGRDPAVAFEELFTRNRWPAAWRNGVYGFHHFHTKAHEALGVYSGEMTVQFGGEDGVVLTARAGDVIVLPAGTGHKKLSSEGSLGIVGAYPSGQRPDMNTPLLSSLKRAMAAIEQVGLPECDPVHGAEGPLFAHWKI